MSTDRNQASDSSPVTYARDGQTAVLPKPQRGFTLLELMVALSIFAMLAVSGWQVFDAVNRSRERAHYHSQQLSQLQYAYLQVQQDSMQLLGYEQSEAGHANTQAATPALVATTQPNATQNANAGDAQPPANLPAVPQAAVLKVPAMTLDTERVSFVRFSDPDPRYLSGPSLQRVSYHFEGERLLRTQTPIDTQDSAQALQTVVLEGVSAGQWLALLPEASTQFPNTQLANTQPSLSSETNESGSALLPRGIRVDFEYEGTPISWTFALVGAQVGSDAGVANAR